MLHKGDHKRLFTHFKGFYVHRMQYVGLNPEYKVSLFDTYDPMVDIKQKPDISEKTTKLADKKRREMLGGKDTATVS